MSVEGAALFYAVAGPVMLAMIGFLVKSELKDIKARIKRLENVILFRNNGGCDHDDE